MPVLQAQASVRTHAHQTSMSGASPSCTASDSTSLKYAHLASNFMSYLGAAQPMTGGQQGNIQYIILSCTGAHMSVLADQATRLRRT